jgi:hypothetical protein
MALKPTCLVIEPPQGVELLLTPELRVLNGGRKDPDRLVVDTQRHREGVPVLATMGEGEARRFVDAGRRPVQSNSVARCFLMLSAM